MTTFNQKKKEQWNYYSEIKINKIRKPITILCGPNGTGKSTSIREMKYRLKNKIKYISYSTSKDDIVTKSSGPFNFRPEGLVCAFHSEGERMCDSFYSWCEEILVPTVLKNSDPLYVFIDEADSGLSIDRLIESFNSIITIAEMEHNKKRRINFIITSNSYELCELFKDYNDIVDYIWVPTKRSFKATTYKAFKKKYIKYYNEVLKYEN